MPKVIVTPGVNDLATTNSELVAEWHPTKNYPRTVNNTYAKSEVKIHWVCSKNPNHEWESIVYTRTKGTGCPFCSNKRVLQGDNDLATTHPELAKYWDYVKNGDLLPTQINAGSNKQLWWVCAKGLDHSWQAPPARLKNGFGCPFCSGRNAVSGESDIATTHPGIAAEWDQVLNGDLSPAQVKAGSNKAVWWVCSKYKSHSWKAIIASRALSGRGCPFCSNQRAFAGFNDLKTTNPEIASQWDFEKNTITPQEVLAGSREKVWWHCQTASHSYEMAIFRRTNGGNCNICAGKTVVSGINDLASQRSNLLDEWDFAKNGDLDPRTITSNSNKKVWWICKENPLHSWDATPNGRNRTGCPICSGKRVIEGVNDLQTTLPELAKQWSLEANNGLLPSQVGTGSKDKYWWVCPQDSSHKWQASLSNRAKKGYGCPICSNQLVQTGFNDLETLFPELSRQWDYSRNDDVHPSEVLAGTEAKFWWKCQKDNRHHWKATVSSRTLQKTGCPICSNLKVIAGVNDLQTTNPDLLRSWHPTKNLPVMPSQITAGTHKTYWWSCEVHPEHEWRTAPVMRVAGTGCPFCSNQRVFTGFNDLETVNPTLASDWHPTKNGSIVPSSVAPNANKKFWWKCFNDPTHEWMATPGARSRGSGCPTCANSGYDATRKGVFYYIQHPEWKASKVGITNPDRNTDRIAGWKKAGWVIVQTHESQDGSLILALETSILRWLRKDLGLMPYLSPEDMSPMGGWSETFATDGVTELEVLEKMQIELRRLEEEFASLSFE